jgi:hypothetical protein
MLLHWTLDHLQESLAALFGSDGKSFQELGKESCKSFVGPWYSCGRVNFDYLVRCSGDVDLELSSLI